MASVGNMEPMPHESADELVQLSPFTAFSNRLLLAPPNEHRLASAASSWKSQSDPEILPRSPSTNPFVSSSSSSSFLISRSIPSVCRTGSCFIVFDWCRRRLIGIQRPGANLQPIDISLRDSNFEFGFFSCSTWSNSRIRFTCSSSSSSSSSLKIWDSIRRWMFQVRRSQSNSINQKDKDKRRKGERQKYFQKKRNREIYIYIYIKEERERKKKIKKERKNWNRGSVSVEITIQNPGALAVNCVKWQLISCIVIWIFETSASQRSCNPTPNASLRPPPSTLNF